MKQDRITKLYEGLTNKERAALSFRYILDANELELSRVGDTVEFKSYRCHDAEYREWLQSFFTLASHWGLIYWQHYSGLMATIALRHATIAGSTTDDLKSISTRIVYWKRRLLALDVALDDLCTQHGVDVDVVRRYSEVDQNAITYADLLPDSEYQANIQAALNSAMN